MFRTELTIAPQERQFSRSARILTVGSCFADSIGERLRLNKVTTLANPFGTVFQPLALAQLLRAATGEGQDWQQHLVEARGRWQSYDFHGTVGAESPVELLQAIQQKVQQVSEFVRSADAVVLTLGTAWAYRLLETGELVSNLHKMPAGLFEKELLTADEIINALAEVHAGLRRVNPGIRIVLTVSPVRHLKDTLPLNAVSKSVLRVACHYLSELLPGVSYFPAYELLTDDLRDYRYYGADMLHPTEVAEDYVWEKFARAYFDADFGRFRQEWAAVRQALGHRPLHAGAPEHRYFLDQTRERLERLAGQGADVRPELRDVQRQLAALPPPRPVRQPEPELEDDGEERIDIGDEAETKPTARPAAISAATPAATAEAAAPTEREGRGRNRRSRGRGRDRDRRDAPLPDAATVTLPAASNDDTTELPVVEFDTELLPDETPLIEAVEAAIGAEPAALESAAGYPAKKKKRRSRGGAKRTARKHAARLGSDQPTAENLPIDPETGTVDAGPAEELSLLADLVVGQPPANAAEATGPAAAEANPLTEAAAELEEPLGADTAETNPLVRKRGTGPTPKKSKVIAKSTPVKRPKRTGLFRAALPTQPGAAAATEAGEPAEPIPTEAPIISPPIVPVALMERPAVAELVEAPASAPTAPEATTPEPVAQAKPSPKSAAKPAAKPKPSRPKAAAPAAKKPEATVAKATRPKRAAPAKKSEPAATTTKRGRPPGKKSAPPAAETPAS